MQKARDAEEQAFRATSQAREDGISHLSTAEINAIYGGPSYQL
jgi:hypothetical protein